MCGLWVKYSALWNWKPVLRINKLHLAVGYYVVTHVHQFDNCFDVFNNYVSTIKLGVLNHPGHTFEEQTGL